MLGWGHFPNQTACSASYWRPSIDFPLFPGHSPCPCCAVTLAFAVVKHLSLIPSTFSFSLCLSLVPGLCGIWKACSSSSSSSRAPFRGSLKLVLLSAAAAAQIESWGSPWSRLHKFHLQNAIQQGWRAGLRGGGEGKGWGRAYRVRCLGRSLFACVGELRRAGAWLAPGWVWVWVWI